MTPSEDHQIHVTSIYGAQTRRGLVKLVVESKGAAPKEILLPPSKAREIASFLLEAAGGAEGDEALMTVLERLDYLPATQGQMMMAIRSARSIIDRRARAEARRAIAEDQTDPDRPA